MNHAAEEAKVLTRDEFFESLHVARHVNMKAVDDIVWAALKERKQYRDYLVQFPQEYSWYVELRGSVFESPVFDKECVLSVLAYCTDIASFEIGDLESLVLREEFDLDILTCVLENLTTEYEKIDMLEMVERVKDIPTEWYVELYCTFAYSWVKKNRAGNVVVQTLPTVLHNKLLSKVSEGYPDMPTSWVERMLQSLLQTGRKKY